MSFKKWFNERVPIDPDFFKAFSSEPVPDHLRHWWWCLGGTPMYLFIVQMITGLLLSMYYIPSVDHAYDSVKNITENVNFGWYIRSVHKWSANFMIASVILHMIRVFITGSYRKPREVNWMVGTFLFVITLLIGFSGYSLIYEQLSYWGLTVAGNLLNAVPLIGGVLSSFIKDGDAISQFTLSRMYVFHAALLPILLVVLLVIHVALMHLLGITTFFFNEKTKRKTFPFIPDHLFTEIIIAIILMILLSFMAITFPAGLEERANPLITPAHIKPEWYFYFTFRILKITSISAAVLIIGAAFFILFLWPFIDGRLRKNKKTNDASVYIGIAAVFLLCGLTLWECFALFLSH